MAQIRFKGFQTGTPVTLSNVSSGASSGAVNIPAFQAPAAMTGLPRIRSGQAAGDTLTLDTTGLTGITGYAWRAAGGAVLGTSATFDSTSHSGTWIECALTCDQGVLTSPAVQVYMQMAMASHNADDAALLTLVPHEDITHLAVADGAWTEGTTWSGGQVPGNGARVLIPHGRSVTYDQSERCRLDWVRIDGTLTWSLTQSTVIFAEHLIITRGGALICGTSTGRLPAQHRAEFIISGQHYRDNSYFATDMNLARDARLIGRGIISQGTRRMWGAHKTSWLRTVNGSAPMATDTTLALSEAPVGWEYGDRIVVAGTLGTTDTDQSEVVTITNIAGAVISFTPALAYDHDHHNSNVTRTDLQPPVSNLSRNIIIQSEDDTVPAWQRGHTMDMHSYAKMDLWDVRHYALGRTVKDISESGLRAGIISGGQFRKYDNSSALENVTLTAQSNLQSRYPVHGHFLGFNKPFVDNVNECVVEGTPGWGMTHHACEMQMNNCAIHDYYGAGMVSESGNETGEWLNSVVTGALVKDRIYPKEATAKPSGTLGDFFRHGYAFAMRSRALKVSGNFAADASFGLVFMHRQQNGSISPDRKLTRATLDVQDLQGVEAYSDTMPGSDYPLIHVTGNEACGMYGGGLDVFKSLWAQDHGLNINIRSMKVWGFDRAGAEIQYIGQYALTDFDIVAQETTVAPPIGVFVTANTFQVAVVRPTTEQCSVGVQFEGTGTTDDVGFNATDTPRYMLVAHTSVNDDTTHIDNSHANNGNGTKLRVWSTEPAYVEPSTDTPFIIAEWDGTNAKDQGISNSELNNTLSDSVSSGLRALPYTFDDLEFAKNDPDSGYFGNRILRYRNANGYWTVDGTTCIVFPVYFSDRLTGNWIKEYHGIDIGSNAGGTNNGTRNTSNNVITVSAASISTTADTAEAIDILALASDDEGDTLMLSSNFFNANHGNVTIAGGVATYIPNPGYTGSDIFQVVVEDEHWNTLRVDVNVTVT